jgi:hypothetical protein
MKSNLACLAIMVSKLPSAALREQSVVSLTSSEASSRAFDRPGSYPIKGSAGDHKIYPKHASEKSTTVHRHRPMSFAKILLGSRHKRFTAYSQKRILTNHMAGTTSSFQGFITFSRWRSLRLDTT